MKKKSTKKPTKTKRSSKKKKCEGPKNGGIKHIIFHDVTDWSKVESGIITEWNPVIKDRYVINKYEDFWKALGETRIPELDFSPKRAEHEKQCSGAQPKPKQI